MDFEKLDVWKRSARLSANLYLHFADSRDFGFKDQITRSGLSVPSNIAEGMARPTVNDRVRFLYIAKGSCAELRTQIYIGMEIGYIEREKGQQWVAETKEIAAMLTGLIRKQPAFEPG
ncbi:four helix bundle protein [Billgrantia tianxiuensis]|jgi:four helix bundle protein|uniref:Four helix bundle protein n=1 Tax=Billgrantia tianxiuensis TaxID=2497861 RepID=A0A6I6SM51_9GAMM|nr:MULTISPECIES: four helix bundle protein [Halomonas]MCE8031548.1 four helix bundle protein [Halomonas sp. MCCC 1A11057]QHC50291.1 four helix bundle protein [Halomonas tianxiuensis]